MDPDDALRVLREWAADVLERHPVTEGTTYVSTEQAAAEYFSGLDDWMSNGGHKPGPWAGRP